MQYFHMMMKFKLDYAQNVSAKSRRARTLRSKRKYAVLISDRDTENEKTTRDMREGDRVVR